MARNPKAVRWDYSPCPAALAAFEEAGLNAPEGESIQARLDRLVIMGIYAIRTAAATETVHRPTFAEPNRHYWRDVRSGTNTRDPQANRGRGKPSPGTAGE